MALQRKQPILLIFAGANGSGKTTAARSLLPRENIVEFVNADEIARGLSPFNPSGQAVQAGRLVLKRIDDLIARRASFALETTLSGKSLFAKLRAAKAAGYELELNFLFTKHPLINIQRIRRRVAQGGHHVPKADVERRYRRALAHFLPYAALCDAVNVYDTLSNTPVLFLKKLAENRYRIYNQDIYAKFLDRVNDALQSAD